MVAAMQASHEELVKALDGMVDYFGVGPAGCYCRRSDCPIRIAKQALANAAKLNPTKEDGKQAHNAL